MAILGRLLFLEAAAFAVAASTHSGILITGFEDQAAAIAESIIGAVLLLGGLITLARPGWTRAVAIGAQGFALLGSLVGLSLAVLVGPTTIPDLVFHIGIVVVLIAGLVVAVRGDSGVSAARSG